MATIDEKQPATVAQQAQEVTRTRRDEAWIYLSDHADISNAETVDLTALRHKIDWRIIPFMFCCYTLQFIDKVMYNYAAIMGMKTDIGLKGNDFTNAATAFFVAYLIAEAPNVYLLQEVPPAKWLGANVILWGTAAAASAGVSNYRSLLAARIFLGMFEATIGPSLMLLSSQYYTKHEQAPRFTFWYLGLGFAQIIGGLISFGFQHIHNPSFQGWRIMFLVLGLVTMLVGAVTLFFIPDTPMEARFLSQREKVALLNHVSVNQTGIRDKTFDWKEIIEAILDVQLWLLTLIVVLQSVSSGVVTTYSSTLISSFGYSGPHAALLNMPSGIVSIAFTLLVGIGIRKKSNRWAWVSFCSVPGIVGGGLLSFLPKSNKAGVLIGIYLVNAIVAPLPIIYHWTAANCAGYTKRAFASATVAGSFSIGNIIGPQTFQARDRPDYRPAKIAVLATQAAAAVLTVVLFLYYVRENRRRDQAVGNNNDGGGDESGATVETTAWAGFTDKENKQFRYVL